MTYLALYRAWRPQRFMEVVGQEKTVIALRNALCEGRLSHAYLFSGPRGTGKTSIAKIIAKAVNCVNLEQGEPCNQCSSCHDINNGNFMDVIEIDAASNRGIDEIRDLREKVRVLPAQGKHKVYIIDEVHMLTTEAFNALLKTLEEPPESVIFILATTELQKIPATIRSRCQSYNFRRLSTAEIIARLEEVADSGGIKLEPEALQIIARRANGGLRDALSTLDQIYSYKGNDVNKADVQEVLGLVDDVFLAKLIDAAIDRNTGAVIDMLNTALSQGKEAQQLAREASLYLRDLLLYLVIGEQAEWSVVSEGSRPILEKQKLKIDKNQILKALRILTDTTDKLRFSEGQKFLLELAFLQIASLFEDQVIPVTAASTNVPKRSKTAARSEQVVKSGRAEAGDPLWGKILTGVKDKKIPTHALLVQGRLLGNKENTFYVGYKKGYKFHKEKMEEKENREIVKTVLKEIMGKECEIQFIFLDDDQYNDIIVKKAIEFFGEDIVEIKD
ncbi:MAG: DNA polymerase III subunit gamma/tau [Syntrophomonadaceae bacterium]|nr:DNA polymerase III subunit gamma/tau [Syntrophomonadaceae bacterium]MDD3022731.1 DNA polymerase III subunit gamma/tau [Syntrophomonadaceae bacterium]